MKKIYAIIAGVMLTATVFAQAPEKMSYQAVIRNASNNLTTNQAVGMQISILQGSATGTAVYVETQTPTTNANGLVSLEIGTGTVVSGDFTTIDWANDTYYIKTETDPTGGTSYTITGTTQLMSVPYALHAKTAESITGTVNYTETDPVFGASIANGITATDTANWNNHTVDTDTHIDSTGIAGLGYVAGGITTETDPVFGASIANGITATDTANWNNHTVDTDTHIDSTGIAGLGYVAGAHTDSTAIANMGFVASSGGTSGHYVGELFGGGIVYYVYDNGAHGLIASLDDLDGGSGVAWSGNTSVLIGATAQSFYDGASNTVAMVAQDATANKAGTLCNSYAGGGFTDWYLPASWELNLLYNSAYVISDKLANDGNGATQPLHPENVAPTYGRYWSSTENFSSFAWYYNFIYGTSTYGNKNNTCRVRATRAF